jgi:hypothetical protein
MGGDWIVAVMRMRLTDPHVHRSFRLALDI